MRSTRLRSSIEDVHDAYQQLFVTDLMNEVSRLLRAELEELVELARADRKSVV